MLLIQPVATKPNCGKFLKTQGYQVLNESLKWLRNNELRYGKNASYEHLYIEDVK